MHHTAAAGDPLSRPPADRPLAATPLHVPLIGVATPGCTAAPTRDRSHWAAAPTRDRGHPAAPTRDRGHPAALEDRPPGGEGNPGCPPDGGRPRPDSAAERGLERALSRCGWAHGRHWNHWFTPDDPLAPPYRLDLYWPAERLVVEVDGAEHCLPDKYRADRDRDVRLQILGHRVLRFTNERVHTDVQAVLRDIERMLVALRGSREGCPPAIGRGAPGRGATGRGASGKGPASRVHH